MFFLLLFCYGSAKNADFWLGLPRSLLKGRQGFAQNTPSRRSANMPWNSAIFCYILLSVTFPIFAPDFQSIEETLGISAGNQDVLGILREGGAETLMRSVGGNRGSVGGNISRASPGAPAQGASETLVFGRSTATFPNFAPDFQSIE